jgi:chemotaxis methyl-accepting protein methylase/PAS domain-containing protein
VGLGASAGGLEAVERFLRQVPPASGLAYLVAQHLDPVAEDFLPQLLQRATPMHVHQAWHGMRLEPDTVYVIPPNKDLTLDEGHLVLSPPSLVRGLRLPIDVLFRSLAEELGEQSVGVVLSGMGSDGTLGLRAIRERNGLGVAQEPADAHFDSMPRSVIEAGLADLVGPADDLPRLILSQFPAECKPADQALPPDPGSLARILGLLRERCGQDFSLYKQSTVLNRIRRRLALYRVETLAAYVAHLERNPEELDVLFKELLIGVTRFFRDSEVWGTLGQRLLPALLQDWPFGRVFRAWVPGCSTGEEAYSLAITFLEAMDRAKPPLDFRFQIFATDLDPDAVAKARQGLFRTSIAAEVSPKRLAAFFTCEPDGYRIRQEVRELVVFASHNLITDPPFVRLDLLSCRNLLIYLKPEVQKQLVHLFHYCLEPGGLLCLGTSEGISGLPYRFESLDAKCRLYRRRETPSSQRPAMPPGLAPPHPEAAGRSGATVASLAALAEDILLRQFSPPAVLVNESGDILYAVGAIGKYLDPPAGQANWNIFAMARAGLQAELADALLRARRKGGATFQRSLTLEQDGGFRIVRITLQKLAAPEPLGQLVLIVFTDLGEGAAPGPARRTSKPAGRAPGRLRVVSAASRQELVDSRKNLLAANEELQSANEELQSANEELQSSQEELHFAYEELATSKTELQVMNAELKAVHAQREEQARLLERAHHELGALLDQAQVAGILLDTGLRLRRFTAAAARLWPLTPGDLGRPFTHLAPPVDFPELAEDALKVVDSLAPITRVVSAPDGRWFRARVAPYLDPDHRIDGILLSFADITAPSRIETHLQAEAGRLQNLLDRLPQGCALCGIRRDPDGRPADGLLVKANQAFARGVAGTAARLEGQPLLGLLPELKPLWTRHFLQGPGADAQAGLVRTKTGAFRVSLLPQDGEEVLLLFDPVPAPTLAAPGQGGSHGTG